MKLVRSIAAFIVCVALSSGAMAASTINNLPPIVPFPLLDPGNPYGSVENLWITNGNGAGTDYRITPTQLGYILQSIVPPSAPFVYEMWWNTGVTPTALEAYDGVQWQVMGTLDTVNHAWNITANTLALGGATLGSNTLAVNGTSAFQGVTATTLSLTGALTSTSTIATTGTITSPVYTAIGNMLISAPSGSITLMPGAVGAPQVSVGLNVSGGLGQFAIANNNTAAGTIASSLLETGTANSYLNLEVFETGHTASIITGPGVTGGLTILTNSGPIDIQPEYNTAPQMLIDTNVSGGLGQVQVYNNNVAGGTEAGFALRTGSTNSILELLLNETGHIASFGTGAGVTGGLAIYTEAGPISIYSTSNSAPQVIVNASANGNSGELAVNNDNAAAGTSASLLLETGTPNSYLIATVLNATAASIVSGAGNPDGLTIITEAGPIVLQPSATMTSPQVEVLTNSNGALGELYVNNPNTGGGTEAGLLLETGTPNSYLAMTVAETANIASITSGAGASGGLLITTGAGALTLTPQTSSAPQVLLNTTVAGGTTELGITNNSTAAGTVAGFFISTGTANSYMAATVAETSHIATLATAPGVSGGFMVAADSGSLTLSANAYVALSPGAAYVLQITSAASFTASTSVCGSVSGSTGCLIILDNNNNPLYLPVFGTL